MNMGLNLGDIAPDFEAESTFGKIRFFDWLGTSWGLFFSHPEDYTPVCTTELGVVANLKHEFAKRNVKTIGLSVDKLASHKGWIKDIEEITGGNVDFPIIVDDEMEIATLYGMVHTNVDANFTIRSVFVIGTDKRIKLMLTYPMAVGRNFDEILRVIDALQLNEHHNVMTPANWKQGDKVIMDHKQADKQHILDVEEVTPYLRYIPQPKDS